MITANEARAISDAFNQMQERTMRAAVREWFENTVPSAIMRVASMGGTQEFFPVYQKYPTIPVRYFADIAEREGGFRVEICGASNDCVRLHW